MCGCANMQMCSYFQFALVHIVHLSVNINIYLMQGYTDLQMLLFAHLHIRISAHQITLVQLRIKADRIQQVKHCQPILSQCGQKLLIQFH